MKNELLETPVVIFGMDERTKKLSSFCFEKIGFNKIILLEEEESFSAKMERFFSLAEDKEYEDVDMFIRSDADRLVFDGILDVLLESKKYLDNSDDKMLLSEGYGFECFMNKLRGATPHVYSSNFMLHVLDNKTSLIQDIQKPESYIGQYAKNNLNCFKFYKVLTNLHEFEQYPSKMYNAFLNRIFRGHISYYPLPAIRASEVYGPPMELALKKAREGTSDRFNTMSYLEIPKELYELDKKINAIEESELLDYYNLYLESYEKIKKTFMR